MEEKLLTLPQLAERLQMHPKTLRKLWQKRHIPGIRIGHRTLRFDYQEVVAELMHRSTVAEATE